MRTNGNRQFVRQAGLQPLHSDKIRCKRSGATFSIRGFAHPALYLLMIRLSCSLVASSTTSTKPKRVNQFSWGGNPSMQCISCAGPCGRHFRLLVESCVRSKRAVNRTRHCYVCARRCGQRSPVPARTRAPSGGQVNVDLERFNAVAVTMPAAAVNGLVNNPHVLSVEVDHRDSCWRSTRRCRRPGRDQLTPYARRTALRPSASDSL